MLTDYWVKPTITATATAIKVRGKMQRCHTRDPGNGKHAALPNEWQCSLPTFHTLFPSWRLSQIAMKTH